MKDKRIIYLPIEIKTREYHAKTLFMLYAINAGYQVVIGSSVHLNRCVTMLPKGIYIGTSITEAHKTLFEFILNSGHKVAAFDEEGLIYYNRRNFINNRINIDTINKIDLFFTWGQNHSDLVLEKDSSIKNSYQAGNMRFELLKSKYHQLYEKQIDKLRKEYGDYILINTNLGMFNNLIGKDYYYAVMKTMVRGYDVEDESFYKGKYDHQEEIFHSYKELAVYLAASNPQIKIIIRPHPSENIRAWKDIESSNVIVSNKGNIIPWILGSKLVVQKNCTTSVESVFLGKPVITYSVRYDERFDNEITNKIGLVCKTKEEVLNAISNTESIERKLSSDREMLLYYVENMADGRNADTAIISALDSIKLTQQSSDSRNFRSAKLTFMLGIKDIRTFLSSIIKNTKSWRNDRQKFNKLSRKELLSDIIKLSAALNMGIGNIEVTKMYNKLYHVQSTCESRLR